MASGWYKDGCAFACHEKLGWEPVVNGEQLITYDLAKANGIPLREDVLVDAVENAMETILKDINGVHADQVQVGLYAFSDTLVQLSKPTANSTNLKTKLENSSLRMWGTPHHIVLPQLAKAIGKSGTGLSRKDRAKTLVLVTDGATTDKPTNTYKPFDAKLCDAFKNNGVRVVVINTEYPRLDGEGDYDRTVGSYYDKMTAGLENCASPGYYYKANETPEIQAVLSKMAKQAGQTNLAFAR